jgi:hypothetical protein
MTTPIDPRAPHGRDNNGTPLAPYGHNIDGTPRKSNRGARAGQKGNGGRRKSPASAGPVTVVSNLSDTDRKGMLTELADMFIVSPLASASQVPFIKSRIGSRQTDALAGDAFILAQYMPGIADGLILWSKTKPGTLAWLDKLEGAAPALVFTNALLAAGKAIADNHMNPNPSVANAGRALAALKIAQMANAVNEQAARINVAADEQVTREFTAEDFERAGYENAMAGMAA